MAMERLTASPYVASVFANCGVSQITEYSRGGNIHDLVKRARIEDPNFRDLTPLTKLKIAFQLASAVADLHSFESDGVTSLAHNDICCHQFILVDGIFKLNDFHLSVFIGKSPNTDEKCKTYPFFADNVSNVVDLLCCLMAP
jgi:serine/threonine protein kinase